MHNSILKLDSICPNMGFTKSLFSSSAAYSIKRIRDNKDSTYSPIYFSSVFFLAAFISGLGAEWLESDWAPSPIFGAAADDFESFSKPKQTIPPKKECVW